MAKPSYLNEENVFTVYKDSVKYMKSHIDKVDEQERIARNKPHAGIAKEYPKVTDGTTSSIIKKTPRRIIQQLPTGRVISDTNDWLSIVAGFIYTNRIIPNANEQYALLQKCWLMVERAMAHGCAHSSAPFVNRGDYFGTDMKVHYIKNVKLESGKLSDSECNVDFIEGWFQTPDIEAIISKEKELQKSTKARQKEQKLELAQYEEQYGALADADEPYNPPTVEADYESTWDLQALEEVKTLITQQTDDETSNSSDNKHRDDTSKSGVKLVTALQRGVGAIQYTIHPSSQRIVRRKKNKDPRGEPNLQTLYFETDGISPTGRGIIDQVGSLQNLMDAEMQMYQYNRALMLNPPIIKKGGFSKTQIKFAPNAIIDLQSDPNASIETLKIDSTAINNFPNNYGLLKSQLLNLAASPDTSISSTVGNPGFSKTHAGVEATQQNVSVDDNYIRKQFETWFERWSETAINLYFAERTGTEELQLDEPTALKLKKLEAEGKLEQGFVSDDNKIIIDYDSATEALKFEVDASTSNMKNDAQQLEALDGITARLEKNPTWAEAIPVEKKLGLWNSMILASGVENPEDLTIDIKEFQEQQQLLQKQQAAQEQAMLQAAQNQPVVNEEVDSDILPAQEPQISQEDLEFLEALRGAGYSDEKIEQAYAMDQQGVSNEEILQVLEMSA